MSSIETIVQAQDSMRMKIRMITYRSDRIEGWDK